MTQRVAPGGLPPAAAPAPARAPRIPRAPGAVRVGGDHVDLAHHRPQVDHVGIDLRQAVVVLADAGALVAGDVADEGHLAAWFEHCRIVEAGAAGDEAAVAGVGRVAVRTAAG